MYAELMHKDIDFPVRKGMKRKRAYSYRTDPFLGCSLWYYLCFHWCHFQHLPEVPVDFPYLYAVCSHTLASLLQWLLVISLLAYNKYLGIQENSRDFFFFLLFLFYRTVLLERPNDKITTHHHRFKICWNGSWKDSNWWTL